MPMPGALLDGVFTDRPGTLSNDFFVNLIDMSTVWASSSTEGVTRVPTAPRANSSGQLLRLT